MAPADVELASSDANVGSSVMFGTTASDDDVMCPAVGEAVVSSATPPTADGEDQRTRNKVSDTESDSESSSDTDIDAAVDEYHVTRLTVLAQRRQDDALIDVRCPDAESYRRAVCSLVTYVLCLFVLSTILSTAQLWRSSPAALIVFVIVIIVSAVVSVSAAAYTFFLPRNDDVLTSSLQPRDSIDAARSMTSVRCAVLVSMGTNSILMAFVDHMSYLYAAAWLLIG